MKTILAIVSAVLLAGCSSVVMKAPFPETKLAEEDQQRLKGTWQHQELILFLEFTTNGTPVLATVDWKEGFELKTFDLRLIKQDNRFFFSLPSDDPKEGSPTMYAFGELKVTDQGMVVWMPDVEFFAVQVKSSKLSGTVERGKHSTSVTLENPSAEILNLISTNPAALNLTEPAFLRKVE